MTLILVLDITYCVADKKINKIPDEKDKQCTYNVTLRRAVRETTVAMKKQ